MNFLNFEDLSFKKIQLTSIDNEFVRKIKITALALDELFSKVFWTPFSAEQLLRIFSTEHRNLSISSKFMFFGP